MVQEIQAHILESRQLFREAVTSKNATSQLQSLTRSSKVPVLIAYHGAAQALYANHLSNSLKKLPFAQKSLTLFQQAVASDPDHPEIRFLRLAITANMPSFLRNRKMEEEDIAIFLSQILSNGTYLIRDEEAREFLQHLLRKRIVSNRVLSSAHLQLLSA